MRLGGMAIWCWEREVEGGLRFVDLALDLGLRVEIEACWRIGGRKIEVESLEDMRSLL